MKDLISARDRAVGSLIGLAVGDALGTTLEFTRRDEEPPVTDMVGGGPFRLRPGEWTDDTSMALCLADSLLAAPEFDPLDLMQRFRDWYLNGVNSVNGRCFDIGTATREALNDFVATGRPYMGNPDLDASGNGSLMRLAPVAIRYHHAPEKAAEVARLQSRTTHASPLCLESCAVFARMLGLAFQGAAKPDILALVWDLAHSQFFRFSSDWQGKTRRQIRSSGYVVDTLEAALWCFARSDTFAEAVLMAINLGDDADTVGAVTGQIAGVYWGYQGIPEPWRARLAWHDAIRDKALALFALASGGALA